MTEVLCVVESPKGSRNKYEWDPDHQLILLNRFLSASVVFPVDYGFIPDTLDPPGEDPLDVLVAVSEREGHEVTAQGWGGPGEAEEVIAEGQRRAKGQANRGQA